MGLFDGKRALVTGGASGIGLASATRLADEGAHVVIVDVNAEAGGKAAAEHGFTFVEASVGDSQSWRRIVDEVVRAQGGLEIAHLNAGVICGESDVTKISDEQYERIMGANLDGVFYGTRSLAPLIEEAGGGAIVCTASLAGLISFAPDPVYTLTKHAVVGFVRAVAQQLAARKITINAICPGVVATPLLGAAMGAAVLPANIAETIPGLIQPAEIAQAVVDAVQSGDTGQCWAVSRTGMRAERHVFANPPGLSA